MKPQMPDWARHPDPSYVDTLERLRRRYAWRMGCKAIVLNEGTPYEEPFGIELALAFGERLAEEVLVDG